MSSQQPVTNSDGAHPPVPLKLSEQEKERVQQADSKLQDYVKESHVQVRTASKRQRCDVTELGPEFLASA